MGTHLPTKLHRGRLSPAVCKGAGGFGRGPHGTPKSGKKVLTLWLVRASDLEDRSELTKGDLIPEEMVSHSIVSHKRWLFAFARRYSDSRLSEAPVASQTSLVQGVPRAGRDFVCGSSFDYVAVRAKLPDPHKLYGQGPTPPP